MRICPLALSLVTSLLAGCSPTSDASVSSGNGPAFDPITFFSGHTHSWGVIENRSGSPMESIVTDTRGETDATNRLRMVQHLSLQDGTTQERDWSLWRTGPDRFEANGRVFHWQWVLARSPGNALMNVTMNQWMYRMQDGSVTIRTTISKLGLIVAEVTEQFVHVENEHVVKG